MAKPFSPVTKCMKILVKEVNTENLLELLK